MKIVLASSSPRRAALLNQLKLTFTVDPSDAEETFDKSQPPDKIVEYLAELKGKNVAKRHSNSMIIAADTMVFLGKKNLGKPSDFASAKNMLELLSNNQHDVYTGVYIAITDKDCSVKKTIVFFERTKVQFATLTEREIEHYINTERPFDKAGSYGIQDDIGALFIKEIDGDFYNVMGFPIHAFYQHLKTIWPDITHQLFFTDS